MAKLDAETKKKLAEFRMAVRSYMSKQDNYNEVLALLSDILKEEAETESADELFEKLLNAQIPLDSKSLKKHIMQLIVSNEIVNQDKLDFHPQISTSPKSSNMRFIN